MKVKHLSLLCVLMVISFSIKGMLPARLARLFPTVKSIYKPTFPINNVYKFQARNYLTLLKNNAKPSLWVRIKSRIPLTEAYFVRIGAIETFNFNVAFAKHSGVELLFGKAITLQDYVEEKLLEYQNEKP